jgi:outer membrane protein TolC
MTKRLSSFMLIAVSSVLLLPAGARGQQAQPSSVRSPAEQLPLSGSTANGSVTIEQTPAPGISGPTTNTLNSSIRIQGPFQGSTPTGTATREALALPLEEAVRRGLAYNLGVIGATQMDRDARALRRRALAQFLPDVNGTTTFAVEQVSLATLGLQSAKGIPGLQFARVLGPFNFFDAGIVLNQTVFDLTAIRNYRASQEIAVATTHGVRNSRDLVILAVGGSYLHALAAAARVDAAKAQLNTAQALYEQTVSQNNAGVNARIDVSRSQVELQSQRLRLISLQTDLASQKLALGRIIGLPLDQDFLLSTTMEYSPSPLTSLEDALALAFANRPDLQPRRLRCARLRKPERQRRLRTRLPLPSVELVRWPA